MAGHERRQPLDVVAEILRDVVELAVGQHRGGGEVIGQTQPGQGARRYLQQQGVEWHARRSMKKAKGAIKVEVVSDASKPGKDKLTPKGKVEDRPQLGNGKA